jgi:hypothetical protein
MKGAKMWMCMILVALALPFAAAEKYYVLTAHLAGKQALISSVKMENIPVSIPEDGGNYRIEVSSQQHEVLYSGSYALSTTPAEFYIPYDKEGNYLTIRAGTGEVLQRVSVALFASVCGDWICQSSETSDSCRQDCPLVSQEATTNATSASQNKTVEPQVEHVSPVQTPKKTVARKPAKRNIGEVIIWTALAGVVLISGGLWFIVEKAKKERLGQIRQYLQRYAYYPPEQVRWALLKRGIKEEDIEEALRTR